MGEACNSRCLTKQLKTFSAPNLVAPTLSDICFASLLPATLIAWDDGIASNSAQLFRGLGLESLGVFAFYLF